ncbi:MAG: hypothetical protein IPK50_08530 [Fibrobacterota bacterium]|nr:MAG: hypothetical protein IPK50_08530 [Fibrobacterota bacterium]
MNQSDANEALERALCLHSCGNEYSKIESDLYYIAEFKKPSGFALWISSQENEFTIGCDDNSGVCIWHHHIASKYGFEDEEQKIGLASELNEIFKNKSKICISKSGEERFWKEIG